jgi:glycosyltransferase involved in cell wall biosynthesis
MGAAGWDVVLVHRWGGPLRAEMDSVASRSVTEPWSRLRARLRGWPRTKRWANRLEALVTGRVLARLEPDLVWCNTVVCAPYAAAAVGAGLPAVVFAHEAGPWVAASFDRAGLAPGAPGLTLVGCSTHTAEELARVLGLPTSAVAVLHSPVDVAGVRARASGMAPEATEGGPIVVGCGVANEIKGIDVFEAAARRVCEARPGVRWVWVGRVDADRQGGAVDFVGEVADPSGWIARAAVFVLSSRSDPFPLVVLEAMALARPVVASDLPGPREQLGERARFFAVADADALADEVVRLLDDPAGAGAMGAAAARRCEEMWDVGRFGSAARSISSGAMAGAETAT